MIEIIKNLPVPVIIAISVLAYIIIAIIFIFLLGLVTHDEDYATDDVMVGLLWIVGVPILLIIKLIQLLLRLSYITYYKANKISLRHRKKYRRR